MPEIANGCEVTSATPCKVSRDGYYTVNLVIILSLLADVSTHHAYGTVMLHFVRETRLQM